MTEFFVDRPIFAWVLSIVIVLVGTICLFTLPIAQYPPIAPPNIQVTASYPGASADTVAQTIGQPIEEQVNGVPGMIYMSSTADNSGNYRLNVTFEVGTDIQTALMLVQTRVLLAMPQLPETVQKEGLVYKMQSPNILLVVNLTSPNGRYDATYLSNYAQINIFDRISRLDGVSTVSILGQRQYSMRAWIDPQKLASLNMTASEVIDAISEQNVEVAAGSLGQQPVPQGQDYQLVLNTLGRLATIEEFGSIVVKVGEQGRLVYLRDVARIDLGAQNFDVNNTYGKRGPDGEPVLLPAIGLAIYQLPQANALSVAKSIKSLMDELKQSFPSGVDYEIGYDTTPYINESVDDVFNTLYIAAALVIIVVLVFLQDWRAMLLPIIDIVVSLIGTFAIMALLGFSLNNLSLFGLVLAIGIVVDDSIVVVENIERWMGMGLPAREATIKAMHEITGPVVGITLVLSSVFIPTAFVPGLTGEFFQQFALTIASSTIISASNALTMAPARATAWIRPHKHGETREALPRFGIMALFAALALWLLGRYGVDFLSSEAAAQIHNWQTENLEVWAFRAGAIAIGAVVGFLLTRPINLVLGWFFGLFNKFFDAMTTGYTRVVGGMLRISIIVLIIYGGLLFLTYKSFTTAPTGFIPEQDQGYLITQVELPESSSVQRTQVVVDEISKIALKTPGVRVVVGIAGFSAFYQCNSSSWGTVFIILDDFSKRQTPELQGTAIQQRLNREIYEKIIDAKVAVLGAPSVPGLGQSGGFQLQIEDELGLGLEALQEATESIVEKANQQPVLRRVFTSFTDDAPQLYLDIDREKAKELGVSLSDVFRTLTANYGSLYVNQFNLFGRIWQVNIQSEGKFRTAIDQFEYLKVRNASGDPVPLTSIVQVRPDTGPIFVMRYNDLNSSPIFGAAAPGFSSGQALSLMEQLCKDNLPNGMTYEWTNIAYQQVTAGNTGILVFGLSVLLVFLVLAALYESWSLPFAIILVVPMCLLASVVGLVFVAHLPVDIFSQIGFIVLIGLAAKNAILVVEFAKEKKKEGLALREATLEACKVRLRPILMTALAFILGVYPLVVAHGAGWEMRHSLGTAVFAGMIGVTLFGIFLTPVFYYSITWLADRKKA